ncbi:MAG: hypothetical protein DMD99_11860 [Candidatus Rokuibacteriota bacterium]|nr:MAG: hypothetical protein DMD99_11860 [Candidatus Rokubacteria bacterium]
MARGAANRADDGTASVTIIASSEGRRDEARRSLENIDGWFTAGFDTADLREAKALLEDVA